MVTVEEREKKYLVAEVNKSGTWDKEHIVYQWYVDVKKGTHTKEKIIFDLLKARIIYVRIEKITGTDGITKKNVDYLNIDDFDPDKMVNVPFVLKRRSIKGKLFLDRFVRSNGISDYLLEDEANEIDSHSDKEFSVIRDVTDENAYYNQNMTTLFTKEDAYSLKFMLSVFRL